MKQGRLEKWGETEYLPLRGRACGSTPDLLKEGLNDIAVRYGATSRFGEFWWLSCGEHEYPPSCMDRAPAVAKDPPQVSQAPARYLSSHPRFRPSGDWARRSFLPPSPSLFEGDTCLTLVDSGPEWALHY